MYSSQEPGSSQPQMDPYAAQGTYPPPESTAYPYPSPPQGGYQYPPQQGAGPYPYPPQGTYMPQGRKIQNRRANRAMLCGIFSIFLALVTLVQEVGAAGVITGTFAIIYGFTALKVAKQLPGNVGHTKAITAIVLGFVAWFLVIVSLIIRFTLSGS
jgi:hypothetical protein